MLDSQTLLMIGSLGIGTACAWSVWNLLQILTARRLDPEDRYESLRVGRLREVSGIYRWCEPLVREVERWFPAQAPDSPLTIALENSPVWKGLKTPEFQAAKLLEGVAVSMCVFGIVAVSGFVSLAACVAIALGLAYTWLATQSIVASYQRSLRVLRTRLPMVVDQLALMVEAGSNFEESLRTIVAEDANHPLNIELSKVVHEIDAGRSRRSALIDFKERLPDADVSELVYAITKGEELGTPLSAILSGQAEQMRLKRSQWGEKAAAEAEVQIVFPGMLVMIACLIVVIAPILLPAVFNVFD